MSVPSCLRPISELPSHWRRSLDAGRSAKQAGGGPRGGVPERAPPPPASPAPAPPPARRGCLLRAASSGSLSPRGTPLPLRLRTPRARSPFPAPAPLSAASAPHRVARRVPVSAAASPCPRAGHGGGRRRRADETATHAGKERGGRGPQTKAAARRGCRRPLSAAARRRRLCVAGVAGAGSPRPACSPGGRLPRGRACPPAAAPRSQPRGAGRRLLPPRGRRGP